MIIICHSSFQYFGGMHENVFLKLKVINNPDKYVFHEANAQKGIFAHYFLEKLFKNLKNPKSQIFVINHQIPPPQCWLKPLLKFPRKSLRKYPHKIVREYQSAGLPVYF